MIKKRSFTLMELAVVIIILGILTTLGITHYAGVRERALDREAQANLRLIQAAEKIYRMEEGRYYGSGVLVQPQAILDINGNLRLLLPAGANRSWDYITTANNAIVPPTCCAEATRLLPAPNNRTWRMRNTENDPVPNNSCP